MNIKSIYIFGVGGIGGFIGSRIIQGTVKDRDVQVYFIVRGAHGDEIRRNGLILETEKETVALRPALATPDLTDLPEPDLCIVCVKSYDLEDVCTKLNFKIRQDTVIIPVLNGIDIYERMRKIIHAGFILPGCVYMNSFIKQPGVVKHIHNDLVIFGKDPRHTYHNMQDVIKFLNAMPNIRFQFKDDPYPAIWEKYMFVAAYALVTAHSRQTIRKVYENTELKNSVMNILSEIRNIAEKKGYSFSEDIIEKLTVRGGAMSPDAITSYQRDMAVKGRKNEGDIFGDTILRLGREVGVPTPVTKKICDQLSAK